MIYIAQKS